jgi:hypothetical protein
MKPIKYTLLLIAAMLAVFFPGCSEKIDLELNETYSRLVVEGFLSDGDSDQFVSLTKTTSYFNNEQAPRAANARVTISDGETQWTLSEMEPGIYQGAEKIVARVGETYTLAIEYDGQVYTAQSAMAAVAGIDSLSIRPHPWLRDHSELLIHFQEPAATEDFYMWKVYRNDIDLTSTINRVRFSDDGLVNGQYVRFAFYTFQPEEGLPTTGDTIRVEMYSISKEYYFFLDAMRRNQGTVGGPFTGPPSNIPGNISDGALGFFLVSAVSVMEMVVDSK